MVRLGSQSLPIIAELGMDGNILINYPLRIAGQNILFPVYQCFVIYAQAGPTANKLACPPFPYAVLSQATIWVN